MAFMNIDLPDYLKRAIEAEAERRGLAQKAIVILALEAYLGVTVDPSDPAPEGADE